MLYLAVAESLGLDRFPVRLVPTREHAFVRWDKDNRHDPLHPDAEINRDDINCDPVNGDWEMEDEDYIDGTFWFLNGKANKQKLARTCYLQSISPDSQQILSFAYWNVGRAYDRINLPLPDEPPTPNYYPGELRESVDRKRNLWTAEHNRIWDEYRRKGRELKQKAIDAFTRSIELNPKCDLHWGSRSSVLHLLESESDRYRADKVQEQYFMPFGN